MPHLELHLLGPCRAFLDGEEVNGIQSNKIRGLLAYLAVEADAVHSRARLAALLWPDLEESRALGYLRHALTNLRQVLGEADNAPPCLLISRATLQFNRQSDYTLDVDRLTAFEEAVAAGDPADVRLAAAQQAVDAYAGPFLDGFTIYACPDFEHWLLHTRTRLQTVLLNALDFLVEQWEADGDFTQALAHVDRQLLLQPWHERAHQHKMRLLWRNGDRTAALRQYETCVRALADELDVAPSPATEALHAQIQHAAAIPPTSQATSDVGAAVAHLPTELRSPLTAFIGRATSLADTVTLVRTTRLVTLTGPGGVGKTRLALAAGQQLEPDFPDGVFAVTLAPLQHTDFVWYAVANALGIDVQGGQPLPGTLADLLGDKTVLIILDNFEHLLTAAPQLAMLLRRASGLHILATSRAPLQIHGEQEYPVAPLALPLSADQNKLEESEAVHFFVDRVRLITPGFHITSANALAVARICVALDGLPLALELAATQLKYMTVDELLAQLDEHTHLAWTSNYGTPGQLATLEKTVAWSYDLLDDGSQQLMRSLGVFNGGFTLAAARAVHTDVADGDIPSQVRTLVNFSLVQRVDEDAATTRFTMLETIRQFAAQRLEASDVCQATHRAHAAYFLALAQSMAGHSMHLGVHPQLTALDAEDDNLRAALNWALANDASELALGLGAALGGYWITRFRMQEGITWLTRLLQLPACEEMPATRVRLLATLGRLLELSGDYPHAQTALAKAVALARAQANPSETALALSYSGLLARTLGDSAEAKALFAESAALYAELDQRHGEVLNRAYTANCDYDLGELDAAEEQYQLALRRASDLDDAFIRAYLLWRLSDNLAAQERIPESKELLVQAAARFKELQTFKALAGYARVTSAQVAMAKQDYPEMLRAFRVSLEHSLRTSFFWGYTYALSACALALAKLGRLTDAYTVTAFVDHAFRSAGAPLANRQVLHDEVNLMAETHLDAEIKAAAWQRGTHMTLSEITALALVDN